jgi:hypothetical protein
MFTKFQTLINKLLSENEGGAPIAGSSVQVLGNPSSAYAPNVVSQASEADLSIASLSSKNKFKNKRKPKFPRVDRRKKPEIVVLPTIQRR